jgi:hypothetical protein
MAEARNVSARTSQAGDQAILLGIGDRDEYDRHRRGRLLQSVSKLVRTDQDDVDMLPHEVPRCAQHSLTLALGAPREEKVVLHLPVSELTKPVSQRTRHGRLGIDAAAGGTARHEESDPPNLPCRLPLGGERRGEEDQSKGAQNSEPGEPHRCLSLQNLA